MEAKIGRKYRDRDHDHGIRTSWPLPLTTSGASVLRLIRGTLRCFFPKWNKDLALNTSAAVLRRMGIVPFGHRVPFRCHSCHAPLTPSLAVLLLLFSPWSSSFPILTFGISEGCLCSIHACNMNRPHWCICGMFNLRKYPFSDPYTP